MSDRKRLFIIICIFLITSCLFAASKQKALFSTSLKDLTLEVTTPKVLEFNETLVFQIYIQNNKPYKINARLPLFLDYSIIPETYIGDEVVYIEKNRNSNQSLILEPQTRKHLEEIRYNFTLLPDNYLLSVSLGSIQHQKSFQVIDSDNFSAIWRYKPKNITHQNWMRKRNITVSINTYYPRDNETFELMVYNHGKKEVITGFPYIIEKYSNREWKAYTPTKPDGTGFILVGKYVGHQGNFTHSVDISHLEHGIYRIGKRVVFGTQDVLEYYCEFEVT